MQLKDWLPVIGVVVGVVLGWFFNQLGSWCDGKRKGRLPGLSANCWRSGIGFASYSAGVGFNGCGDKCYCVAVSAARYPGSNSTDGFQPLTFCRSQICDHLDWDSLWQR